MHIGKILIYWLVFQFNLFGTIFDSISSKIRREVGNFNLFFLHWYELKVNVYGNVYGWGL